MDSIMKNIISIEKRKGVDIGYKYKTEPLNMEGRVGKDGIDKTFSLEKMIELARKSGSNIIVKGGKNAKWYLKKCLKNKLDDEIRKQEWRDTSRATMYIIEWDN